MTDLQIEATKKLAELDKHEKNFPLWAKGFELALNLIPGMSLILGVQQRALTNYRIELLEVIAGKRDVLPSWPFVE